MLGLTLPGFLSRKSRQEVLILTSDGGIASDSLEANRRCAVASKTQEAWIIDEHEQLPDAKTGKYVQIVSEVSIDPIRLNGSDTGTTTREWVNEIASAVTWEAITYETKRQRRDGIVGWIGVSLVIIIVSLTIMAAVMFFAR